MNIDLFILWAFIMYLFAIRSTYEYIVGQATSLRYNRYIATHCNALSFPIIICSYMYNLVSAYYCGASMVSLCNNFMRFTAGNRQLLSPRLNSRSTMENIGPTCTKLSHHSTLISLYIRMMVDPAMFESAKYVIEMRPPYSTESDSM